MALGGKCELRKCQGRAGLSARDPVGLMSAAVPACPNGACLGGGRFSLPAGAHAKPKAGATREQSGKAPPNLRLPQEGVGPLWAHLGDSAVGRWWLQGGG